MPRPYLNQFILPILIFPALTALALKYIFSVIVDSNGAPLPVNACVPNGSLQLPYTGLPQLDGILCSIVSFFHNAMEPAAYPFTEHLLYDLAPIATFTFMEGTRKGRSMFVSSLAAMIFGVTYQRFSGGATLPIYWLLFILLGHSTRPGKVDAAHAQATVFATIVAYFVPTIAMLRLGNHPYATAFWQAFPVWMFIAQRAFLLVRPATVRSGSGVIRLLYAALAVAGAVNHLRLAGPIMTDLAALKAFFIPYVVVSGDALGEVTRSLLLLQWDGVFINGSAMLATLWFGRSAFEVGAILVWNIVGSFVVGPGAALAVLFAWREGRVGSP